MFLIKIVYFLLVGWWLGALAGFLGYLLCLSIIGLPLGLILLNWLPSIIWMKETGEPCESCHTQHQREPLPFILRVIWFFLLGWEIGFIVLVLGYLCLVSVIGIPFGIYLLNRVPLVLTLSMRYGPL